MWNPLHTPWLPVTYRMISLGREHRALGKVAPSSRRYPYVCCPSLASQHGTKQYSSVPCTWDFVLKRNVWNVLLPLVFLFCDEDFISSLKTLPLSFSDWVTTSCYGCFQSLHISVLAHHFQWKSFFESLSSQPGLEPLLCATGKIYATWICLLSHFWGDNFSASSFRLEAIESLCLILIYAATTEMSTWLSLSAHLN